jgi:hypothetical protein
MLRAKLSVEDHRKVAAEILGILDAHTRILELINGKVPVRILDQLLTFRGVDKATNRLRSDLDDEFYRVHHLGESAYYPEVGVSGIVDATGFSASGNAGFTGNKVAGSCTLQIVGGIILNVTGC